MNDRMTFGSVSRSLREHTINRKQMRRLTTTLLQRCEQHVGTYPIPAELLSFCRDLHASCPLNFLLRFDTTSLIFNLKLYIYILFIEFVVKYKIVKLEQKYQCNPLFASDFEHFFDKTLPPPTFEHVSSHKSDEIHWKLTTVLWNFIAQKIISEPEYDIFSQNFGAQLLVKAVFVFHGESLTVTRHGVRKVYYMNKIGEMREAEIKKNDLLL